MGNYRLKTVLLPETLGWLCTVKHHHSSIIKRFSGYPSERCCCCWNSWLKEVDVACGILCIFALARTLGGPFGNLAGKFDSNPRESPRFSKYVLRRQWAWMRRLQVHVSRSTGGHERSCLLEWPVHKNECRLCDECLEEESVQVAERAKSTISSTAVSIAP